MRRQTTTWTGAALTGALGGIVGAWVMTRFHVALYGRGVTGTREPQSHRPVDGGRHDPATKAADEVVTALTSAPLDEREKRAAGPIVHYAFGASAGALYGVLAHRWPTVAGGWGVPYGLAVWLVADETALPLLGLADGPRAYPWTTHAEMLAAHAVFGSATHVAMTALQQRASQPA
ncbi:hypothetical protein TBR22_A10520 [Luteitalea sp. TBR-22]|uniref:DUF1440 domain-containing protein n=1 Tax=Luteitalea sp. TBR-22 TaxID=2802971 RepID=UPI001AFC6DB0|nr:DUF1440 domain-containing protein [Luteitalea sp. TBR-22]BCS31849.1 hypothetical protein TBR22_A10520 [Luteitalea sp. TBR-22]